MARIFELSVTVETDDDFNPDDLVVRLIEAATDFGVPPVGASSTDITHLLED